jgi:cytochrome c551/c552
LLEVLVRRGLIGIAILLTGIQVIPYGRNHSNPPVTGEPAWDSPKTRELAARACFDCHSNQTVWPWYSHVAPFSWLIQGDVDEGREKLNFSEWNPPQEHARQSAKMVREGRMPQWYYAAIHPQASLSSNETQALIRGLVATFGEEEAEDHQNQKDHD